MTMTITELSRDTRRRLAGAFGADEAAWMTRLMMEQVFARSRVDLILDGDKEAGETRIELIDKIVRRLLAGEPLQYILGFETFMGMKLRVTPAVLIPRPETEELVQLILDREGDAPDLRVLDAGTGSGCIALALSRNLRFPEITAIDISADALDVARGNADALKVRNVYWRQDNILALAPPAEPIYDIIVSNPPYVMMEEKSSMHTNVLDHEPHTALFVPDADPLRFYDALTAYGRRALKPGGRIYFELNPLTAERLLAQMKAEGWRDCELHRDSRGMNRFLSATL